MDTDTPDSSPLVPDLTPLQLGRLHDGDCLELFRRLGDGTVDLIFADPPFNIGYDYDIYDDRRDAQAYLDWTLAWGREVVRVLKPDGTFWLAIGDEFAAELKVLFHRELGLSLRSWWSGTIRLGSTARRSSPVVTPTCSTSCVTPNVLHSTTRRCGCRRRGSWCTSTPGPTPRGGCRTTPGSSGRRTSPTGSEPRAIP